MTQHSEIQRLTGVIERLQTQMSQFVGLNKLSIKQAEEVSEPSAVPTMSQASKHSISSSSTPTSFLIGGDGVDALIDPALRWWGASSSEFGLNMLLYCMQSTEPRGVPLEGTSSHRILFHSTEYNAAVGQRCKKKKDEQSCDGNKSRVCFCPECTWPLRLLNRAEASRLADVYQESNGSLYPFLDRQSLSLQIDYVYAALESWPESSKHDAHVQIDPMSICIQTIALAVALLAETTGASEVATALYASVQRDIEHLIVSPARSIRDVVLLLVAVRRNALRAPHLMQKRNNANTL